MPSHHSSSSHSSSSHSSSSHSSRSSSHSSNSYGGTMFTSRSLRQGVSHSRPSSHSSSSKSSGSSGSSHPHLIERPIARERYNQPKGYVGNINHHNYHYHDYDYYPESFHDSETGELRKAGYYDENGKWYEDIALPDEYGNYTVICFCPYCHTKMKMKWNESGSLSCPNCGGAMEVQSAIDKLEVYEDIYGLNDPKDSVQALSRAFTGGKQHYIVEKVQFIIFLLVILVGMRGCSAYFIDEIKGYHDPNSQYFQEDPLFPDKEENDFLSKPYTSKFPQVNNPDSAYDVFGSSIRVITDGQEYTIVDEETYNSTDSEKMTIYYDTEDNYYDGDKEWCWYNVGVDPPLWQYWVEGISDDYGDYGWMEYEDGVWYIEWTHGAWKELPEKYDTSNVWHFSQASGYENTTNEESSVSENSSVFENLSASEDAPEVVDGSLTDEQFELIVNNVNTNITNDFDKFYNNSQHYAPDSTTPIQLVFLNYETDNPGHMYLEYRFNYIGDSDSFSSYRLYEVTDVISDGKVNLSTMRVTPHNGGFVHNSNSIKGYETLEEMEKTYSSLVESSGKSVLDYSPHIMAIN